jgi:hypothetical protein
MENTNDLDSWNHHVDSHFICATVNGDFPTVSLERLLGPIVARGTCPATRTDHLLYPPVRLDDQELSRAMDIRLYFDFLLVLYRGVGVPTGYGLVQTGAGAHPATCTMGTAGSFPGAWS